MKKKFVEPQVKRVEINFAESIATSAPTGPQGEVGSFNLNWTDAWSCTVISSGIMYDQIIESNFMSTFPCLKTGVSTKSAARTLGLRPSSYY